MNVNEDELICEELEEIEESNSYSKHKVKLNKKKNNIYIRIFIVTIIVLFLLGFIFYTKLKSDFFNFKKDTKETIKNLEEEVNKLSKYTYQLKLSHESKIINIEEVNLIEREIQRLTNKKVKDYILLFKATENNFSAKIFHEKCDYIKNVIIFVKTGLLRRFGGFTSVGFDSKSGYLEDKNSFIFSLDKKQLYNYNMEGGIIACLPNYGPSFGQNYKAFYLIDKCDKNKGNEYVYNKNDGYVLSGEQFFQVFDYEVFQIILE